MKCHSCKIELNEENSYRRKSGRDIGLFTGACRSCAKARANLWAKNNSGKIAQKANKRYHANPEKFRQENHDKRRKLNLLKLDRPCYDCGGIFPPECMQWDHLPGKEKCFDVSKGVSYSLDRVIDEIAKCQLVCSNCHDLRSVTRAREKRGVNKPAEPGTLI